MRNQFLQKIISDLQTKNPDLSGFTIVLPGKRPVVFFKEILQEKAYTGLLPRFLTIEELIRKIAGKKHIQGIALWLFSYQVYSKINPSEDFSSFLKWFPTLLKDWDDILKFADKETEVLSYMLEEERIKNWGQKLDEESRALKKNLDFWRRMNRFLPELKMQLQEKNYATAGMLHELVKEKMEAFAQSTTEHFVFCGFNAFTPVEKKLVKTLLQWDKAVTYFHADEYYISDQRQEAGKFLREYKTWKEFNESRDFRWVENQFSRQKNIKVYEVPGNIAQTKVLPEIFKQLPDERFSETAVILLDENLLPASLDALSAVEDINITMGFPLKNLSFSNAMRKLFHLHRQLEKNGSSYYYSDVISILEEFPKRNKDAEIIAAFNRAIEEKNIVYINKTLLKELLNGLSYYKIFDKPQSLSDFLSALIQLCREMKFENSDDILYENISHFEKSFTILQNQLAPHQLNLTMDTLEVLLNQLVNNETIDFQGEPLRGLQIMGLLETRLLNFKNIIMMSVNEGKLPLGNSQNTYLPFDVRRNFNLNTFLENDSIYAYHFYRLIQDSENVFLLYNALSSGVNTGEKSRFITQIEIESPHQVETVIIENASEPVLSEPVTVKKTETVLQKLEEWKKSISASHLTAYLYSPVSFYLNQILKTRESAEIEEELSQRNYGNLVHYSLQFLYEKLRGKALSVKDLDALMLQIDEAVNHSIVTLNHQPEFYEKGINFIHKSIARKVVESVLTVDRDLLQMGNSLEIVALEKQVFADFYLDEEKKDQVTFKGYIDRIDRLNGKLRIIDYKTARPEKKLSHTFKPETEDRVLAGAENKQALQLAIYAYSVLNSTDFPDREINCGIWSFAETKKGVRLLELDGNSDLTAYETDKAMKSVKYLIEEILNPEIDFTAERTVPKDQ